MIDKTKQEEEQKEILGFMKECKSSKKELDDLLFDEKIDSTTRNKEVNKMYREANKKGNYYYEKYRISVNQALFDNLNNHGKEEK